MASRKLRDALMVGGALAVLATAASAQTTFREIEDLAGGFLAVRTGESGSDRVSGDVSNNGVAVGRSSSAASAPSFDEALFSINPSTAIGDLAGGDLNSRATGVSNDGNLISGTGNTATGNRAFLYNRNGGAFTQIDPLGSDIESAGADISGDGTTVVGTSSFSTNKQAFRWTAGGGTVGLGFLPGAANNVSEARGVNANGTVIVGSGINASAATEAFRWTSSGGMQGLGFLTGGTTSLATDVSPNGNYTVGQSNSAAFASGEAVLWDANGNATALGDLAGGSDFSIARGVTDYRTVVGQGAGADGDRAFIYDPVFGLQELSSVLGQLGVSTPGFTALTDATGISSNGQFIVGDGTDGDNNRAFVIENYGQSLLVDSPMTAGSGTTHFGWLAGSNTLTVGSGNTVNIGFGNAYLRTPPSTTAFQTFQGTVAGDGTLNKVGSGTATISGRIETANIGVMAGTLQLSGNDVIGDTAQVDVASGATLDTGGNTDTIGGLSGAGTTNIGAGTLTIGGRSSNEVSLGSSGLSDNITPFTGTLNGSGAVHVDGGGQTTSFATNLAGGTTATGVAFLEVNGQVLGPVALVNAGILGGTGTVAQLTNTSGIVSPGNSIGTLTISGNFTQSADGALVIEIDDDGTSDLLKVGGSATLDGSLIIVPLEGTYTTGQSFTILTADSGVSGSFTETTVADPNNFLGGEGVTTTVNANDVVVTVGSSTTSVTQESAVEGTSSSRSRAVTGAFSRAIGGRLLSLKLLGGGSFNAPSVEVESSGVDGAATGLSGGDGGFLADLFPPGYGVWADASWTFIDSDRPGEPFRGDQQVALFGIDTLVTENLVLGGVLGVDNSRLEFTTDDGDSKALAGSVTVYGAYSLTDTFSIDGLFGYGRAENDVERRPTTSTRSTGDFSSDRFTTRLNGNAFFGDEKLTMIATAGVSFSFEGFEDYRTSDNITVDPDPTRITTVHLQGDVSYDFGPVQPFVSVGFDYDAGTTDPSADRDALNLGLGFLAPVTDNITVGGQLFTQVDRENESQTSVGVNLRYQW